MNQKFTRINLLLSIFFGIMIIYPINVLHGQDINYIENNRDYVDVNTEQQRNVATTNQGLSVRRGNWKENDQFSTGLLNYGFTESVYYQFSGESIFEDGNPLSGAPFLNYAWTNLNPLDFKIPPAWSYGAEFQYYSSDSESVYSGENDVAGSAINMSLYMFNFNVKAFALDPIKEFLHPYFGVGWGVLTGYFATKQTETGKAYETTFFGPFNYQMIGVQIMLGNKWGIIAEFKNLRGTAATSNDPFDQGEGNSVSLAFDGVIIGLSAYYRM
ncbi:hypothetical protein KJ966_25910 [bacterium]|nr:hypothetical protein [bacterium]